MKIKKIQKRHILLIWLVIELIFIVSITTIFYNEFLDFKNIEYESPLKYDFYEADGKYLRIASKDFVLEEEKYTANATVMFKDGPRELYLMTNIEKGYIDPEKDFLGKLATMYEDGVVRDENIGPTFKNFIDSRFKRQDLSIIILSMLDFLIWIILNYKKLNPSKVPVLKKGHNISQKQLRDILNKTTIIDNIWIYDNYLILNENNYITAVDFSKIIWIYDVVLAKVGVKTHHIVFIDNKYHEIRIPVNGAVLRSRLFNLLIKEMPKAVHGYSVEKERYYKKDKESFVSAFIDENLPSTITPEVEQRYTQMLTDILYEVHKKNPPKRKYAKEDFDKMLKELILKTALNTDYANHTVSKLSAINVLNIAVFSINIAFIIDKFIPIIVKKLFYSLNMNPALSMLRAKLYSFLATDILIVIALLGALFYIILLVHISKNNIIDSDSTGTGLKVFILCMCLLMILISGDKVINNLRGYQPISSYEDIIQIKKNTLSSMDVLIEENSYRKNQKIFCSAGYTKFYHLDRTEKYEHFEFFAQEYPFGEFFERKIFHLPWKMDKPVSPDEIKYYIDNRGDYEVIKNSFYKIYYTDNSHIVVHMERLFVYGDEKYVF